MKKRLFAAGLALAAFAVQPYRLFVVKGISMTPTLADGQFLIGDIHPTGLARGDVVVFRRGGETMVKRVAYLPGDWIERYWLADAWQIPGTERMRESMLRHGYPRQRVVVPPSRVYVLADNPFGSLDSRTFGAIPVADVLAAAPRVDHRAEWALEGGHRGATMAASL